MRAAAALLACLAASGFAHAADPTISDPGRLFYSPAQRAQLEAARTHHVSRIPGMRTDDDVPLLRYDGVVVRSDGKTTRWVNGKPQLDASNVAGLKPGQVRAGNKVYEPYQVLRPTTPPAPKESTP